MTADRDTTNRAIVNGLGYTGATVKVAVSPLDEILERRIPKLIKIDVDGYESEVVAGGTEVFAGPDLQAVIMELNGSGMHHGFDGPCTTSSSALALG
jgi:FkbM family methyltransferase